MMKAPVANLSSRRGSGRVPGRAASAVLQQQGRKRSQVPIGLSILARRMYGCIDLGKCRIHDWVEREAEAGVEEGAGGSLCWLSPR
eukprot:scaffold2320_cov168-Ochromonas_danica.AAC.6